MKILLASIALVVLSGCTDPNATREVTRTNNYCTNETKSERADFILQCIKNANPKSDEEPEDWIRICQNMAEDTLCEKRVFKITLVCGNPIECRWYEQSRMVVGEK